MAPISILEMPEFIRCVADLSEDDRLQLITELAENPERGRVIEGTGGVRKLRWAPEGQGKSGAYRIIYYFHNHDLPVFLLTVFHKGEKDNLSKSEKNGLRKLIPILVKKYKEGRERLIADYRRFDGKEARVGIAKQNSGGAKYPPRA